MELEGRDAAEGRDVLVLLADGFLQDVDFHAAGLFGQLLARPREAERPQKKEMYWSCLPTGSPRMSISMRQACSANSWRGTNSLFSVCSARNSATVKLPLDPSPVPAGISERLTISRCGALTGTMRNASRMMGCLISSTVCTTSVAEYLIRNSGWKVSWSVM